MCVCVCYMYSQLGKTSAVEYEGGGATSSMRFTVPRLDLEHVDKTLLNNAALLQASLVCGDDEAKVAEVHMITQIYIDDGMLMRSVLSPL